MTPTNVCRHCGAAIEHGAPHPEVDAGYYAWFHVEHGGVTCGSPAPDEVAEPNTPAPWVILEDEAVSDRFFDEHEAHEAIMSGEYPDGATVVYVNDPGPL